MSDNVPREVLQALVRGDMERFQVLAARLDAEQDEQTRGLLHAALVVQASRKWGEVADLAALRVWVAQLRNEAESRLGDINPVSCERILVSVLSGDPGGLGGVPANDLTNLTALMTFKLVHEAQPTEAQLEEFVAVAERIAAG